MTQQRAKRLSQMTLAQVDSSYRQGTVSQDEFDEYCHAWRVGAFRYSTECQYYENGPHSILCSCDA